MRACLIITMSIVIPMAMTAKGIDTPDRSDNFLLVAQKAAMEQNHHFKTFMKAYREYLSVEGKYIGLIITQEMYPFIDNATTEAEGRALQRCAEVASTDAWPPMMVLDEDVVKVQKKSNKMHETVIELLCTTNIMTTAADEFLEQHNRLLAEADDKMMDEIVPEMYDNLNDLYENTALVQSALRACLDSILITE